jgi:uncharacterized membrane protein YuzA (DUF378 family)
MAKEMNALDLTSWVLCTVGALNWGLVGAFNLNVVAMLGGMIAKIVYILVGVAGLISLWGMFKHFGK